MGWWLSTAPYFNNIGGYMNYVLFTALGDSITLAFANKTWDGSLYWSIDGNTWNEWTSGTISSTVSIFLRGENNTTFYNASGKYGAGINTTDSFTCAGNIMALLDSNNIPTSIPTDNCFRELFKNCTGMTIAPELPAVTLSNYCYAYMFDGCTGLAVAPTLPATTLKTQCYMGMFRGCRSLASAPQLPSTTLGVSCYAFMFEGCASLTIAPDLPATTLTVSCYTSMFENCTGLITPPALPALTMTPACYAEMFKGCTSLANAPELPATSMAGNCYYYMFDGCTNLAQAPQLPAIVLGVGSYRGMFANCTNIRPMEKLPAMSLASECYYEMFLNCENMETAPELPALDMYSSCYQNMFRGCRSLVNAPELPANNLAIWCYADMFYDCENLVTAPNLRATTLFDSCYAGMFYNCISLLKAPKLPATILANSCYIEMFANCTSLLSPPELPATKLAPSCYQKMFNGCLSIAVSETEDLSYRFPWRIPTDGDGDITDATDWNSNMLLLTSGTFTGNPQINTTYYLQFQFDPEPKPVETTFYQNSAERNRLDKSRYLKIVWTDTITFRDSSSITNPVIRVEYPRPIDFNYVYLSELNRYYFVTDINLIRTNLYEINLSIDVLMTYLTAIKNCQAFIDRNEDTYNRLIVDNQLPLEQLQQLSVTEIPNNVFAPWEGQYVLQGITLGVGV